MSLTTTKTAITHYLKTIICRNSPHISLIAQRSYAAKGKPLTEAQIQQQKHASEMQFKAKTSIRGTPYNFQSLDSSLAYMTSEAYRLAYGDEAVWKKYVRNYGGHFKPQHTRKMCIRGGHLGSGNPCPICRDEYLIVNYKNLQLLKQFISTATGNLFPATVTNVCRYQQENLEIAFNKAVDLGLIDRHVPFREYDYSIYYDHIEQDYKQNSILLDIVLAAKRKNTNRVFHELEENDIFELQKAN